MVGHLGAFRQQELRRLSAWCHDGASGVAVIGARGTGRTWLLRALVDELQREGWTTSSVAGSVAAQGIPFGALAWHLPDVTGEDEAARVRGTTRALAGDGTTPALITVDNAELLDPHSTTVLLELLHRTSAKVVFSLDANAPRPPALADLVLHSAVQCLTLEPAERHEVQLLVSDVADVPASAAAVELLVTLTGGDLALLEALVADLQGAGSIAVSDGSWKVSEGWAPGPQVTQLVASRLARLSEFERDALDCVALTEPVPVDMFPGLHPDAIGRLERAGLVAVGRDRPGRANVAPPVVGAALRANQSSSRRRQLLRALSRDLPEDLNLDRDLASRALAWYRAEGLAVPPELVAAATQAAYIDQDLPAARTLASDVAARHWRAALVLGEIHRAEGELDRALDWFEVARGLARTDHAIGRVALATSGVLVWRMGDVHRGIEVLGHAIEQIRDPRGAVELQCESAFLLTFLGRYEEALRTCEQVLEAGDLDDLAAWNALVCLAYAKVMTADIDGLGAALNRASSLIRPATAEHDDAADLHAALTVGLDTLRGDLTAARATVHRSLAELPEVCGISAQTAAVSVETLVLAGDPDATAVAESAVEQLRGWDPFGTLPLASAYLALVCALQGEPGRATSIVTESAEILDHPRAGTVLARAQAVLGGIEDPVAHLIERGVVACEAGHLTPGLLCLTDALWWGGGPDVRAAIADVNVGRAAPLIDLVLRLIEAVDDADRVLGIGEECVGRGAVTIAGGAFRLVARLRDGVDARRAAARCSAIEADLDPFRLPGVRVEVPDALTGRELDVARRAAMGQTNALIAEALFLSPRTVGNHLQHVYDKLELRGRSELTALLWSPSPRAS